MNIASTIRIAAVLATVSAMAALAGVAQAGTSRPPSMSNEEYRALVLRSEALNHKYGLGSQRAVPQGMRAAEHRALVLRSEALNQEYGLGTPKGAAFTSQPPNPTRGLAWGALGIGAAVIGLALLASGFFVRRRLSPALRGLARRYRTT